MKASSAPHRARRRRRRRCARSAAASAGCRARRGCCGSPRTASISWPIARLRRRRRASAASARGYGAIMMLAVGRSIGSACQISSVTNGMNGCSRRSAWSSTVHQRARASPASPPRPRRRARLDQLEVPVAVLVPDEAGRAPSAASLKRYASRRARDVVDRRLQARQDPAVGSAELARGESPHASGPAASPRFISTKRAAFQILLAKLRPELGLLDRRSARPGRPAPARRG